MTSGERASEGLAKDMKNRLKDGSLREGILGRPSRKGPCTKSFQRMPSSTDPPPKNFGQSPSGEGLLGKIS
jgi:hypothetical protein